MRIYIYLAAIYRIIPHLMKFKYLIGALLTFSGISGNLYAQTVPVGFFENVEDAYRRQQLLGNDKLNSSYMIRPLDIVGSNDLKLGEAQEEYNLSNFRKLLYTNKKLKAEIYLLPGVMQQQYNTHHPYGMNEGSMVQAKGYQMQFSAGVFARIGPLSIQLRPEYVFADNQTFTKLSDVPNGPAFSAPLGLYYNMIDMPDRFGDGDYSKVSLGQSSIRLNAGPVTLGVSNENLWWGPGVRNSLLMSNNASGFKHFTLNTTRPVQTYIGSLEAQIIGGRLNQSGISPPVGPGYIVKEHDWRYISGLVITYQPKWIPNFFLGFDRTFVINHRSMGNGFKDYFPIFGAVEKSAYQQGDGTNSDDAAGRDQYLSFFTRYVLPQSKAEIYFEYGRNDHSYDLRDGVVEPEHARAYTFGFRKLVPLARPDEYIQLGAEVTQLEKSKTRNTRDSGSWYEHYQVVDGYTNEGQVLGAGIGPGSNLQSLDVSWVKGLKRIGLQFERLVNNNDLFYDFAYGSPDKNVFINRHWVDLSVAAKFAWNYKHFILNSQFTYIRSLNYQYRWAKGSDYWDWDKKDVDNMQLRIGLMYTW
jgi:hypothetical protein